MPLDNLTRNCQSISMPSLILPHPRFVCAVKLKKQVIVFIIAFVHQENIISSKNFDVRNQESDFRLAESYKKALNHMKDVENV